MLKSILIEQLAKEFNHLSVQDVASGVNKIIDLLATNLSKGNRIEIRGFGSFNLRYLAARNAHNPKTGKRLIAPSRYRTHFKPGKELRERMNTLPSQRIPYP